MKAVVWHARHDVRVEEVPDPAPPGPDEVILRVASCGICGTDLEEYRSGPLFIPVDRPNPLTGRQAPLILGHEFAGEVVEVGRNVTTFKAGDRVGPDSLLYCGKCYWCRRHQVTLCDQLGALGLSGDGGLAEYCKAPASMCFRLPEGLPYDHAAMAEPLSVAVRAVRKGRLALGETVAIFGGGTIGLLCLQVAIRAGASAVFLIEPHAHRRDLARQLGASGTIDPAADDVSAALRALTGIGPDLVIEASGAAPAGPAAVEAARKGGRIVLVGLPVAPALLDLFSLVASEREVIGSLSHVYDEDYATALHLLDDRGISVDPLITARIPLQEVIQRGLHRLEHASSQTLKIIVHPSGELAPH